MGISYRISPAIQSLYDMNCIECYILMRSLMFYLCVVRRNYITIWFSEICFLLCFFLSPGYKHLQMSIRNLYWVRNSREKHGRYPARPCLQLSALLPCWPLAIPQTSQAHCCLRTFAWELLPICWLFAQISANLTPASLFATSSELL